jgi:NADH:ubiquinone oxidoreductase subunit 6 (subunit J)
LLLSDYLSPSRSLSHRLIHHQRPGALQYIYYIGYVLVIVVRDIKGVDRKEEEEREREKEKVIESAVYITQMYVFVLFLIITLVFSRSLFRIFLLSPRNACQRPRQSV